MESKKNDSASKSGRKLLSESDMKAVNMVKDIVGTDLCDCPQIAELAKLTNTSSSKLQADFKAATGSTIHDYICNERMKRALALLKSSDEPIYRVASSVGCKKPGHFAKLFKERYGQTPTEVRKNKPSEKLSVTLESYLDKVYELSKESDGAARLTDVAASMGVTKSTASASIGALVKKGFIENRHYQHITLTSAGESRAKEITGKHAVVRRFFTEVLSLGEQQADTDACAIEHVISDNAISAMLKILRDSERFTNESESS